MSDFVLVIPEGWIQIDLAEVTLRTNATGEMVASMMPDTLAQMLVEVELLPPESAIAEFQVFDNSYFVLRLGKGSSQ